MAEVKNKIKDTLIKRINSLSRDKLKNLEDFINQLESEKNTRDEILSFAGSLKNMDMDFFKDLTDDLHVNRETGLNWNR
ncbi:MAG: hypothetical protein JW737_07790 [Acidobacteria bacterium]|nr:hypothetical protein [Acidobacteriota bacterium]